MPDPTEPTGSDPISPEAELAAAFPDATDKSSDEPAAPPAPEPVEPPAPNGDVPAAEAAPTTPPAEDFTFTTLENGQRELRLSSGEVFRGKDDQELLTKLASGKLEATRHIQTLNGKLKEVTPPPAPAAPTTPEAIDPTALAIADLMAPAFGVKSGKELVEAFAEQQRTAAAQQEFMAAQAANMEAANFFRAVPEFSKSQADADRIDSFLQENQLPFNAKTAEMAYYTLKAKGEMSVAPTAPTAPRTPKNSMPPPPTGTAPANTGKGAPTEADLWNMSTAQLEELITSQLPQ